MAERLSEERLANAIAAFRATLSGELDEAAMVADYGLELADELARVREAIRRHRDSWSRDFEAAGSSAYAYDQDLWAAIGES